MSIQEFYDSIGGDYAGAIAVFRDDTRLARFLALFQKDPAVDNLKAAVEAQDWKNAFMAAHTLKGTAGNMRLAALAASASALTEAMRGNVPLADKSLYETVLADYKRVCDGLAACLDN